MASDAGGGDGGRRRATRRTGVMTAGDWLVGLPLLIARTAPELGGLALVDCLENIERMAVPTTEEATLLRHKQRRVVAGVRDMTQSASANSDLVRSEGVEHSKQRVRRRVERYKRRWHRLRPMHAVRVLTITDAVSCKRLLSHKLCSLF